MNMKLFLELGAKTHDFLRGMTQSSTAVSRFASGARKELASLRDMSTSIRGQLASIGLTVGAGKIMLDSARLDKTLTRIGQTAGEGSGKVRQLRAELFRMGRESGQVVEDLQDGFNDLVQSGLNMTQAKETLKGINVAMAVTGSSARTLASGLTVGAEFFDFDLAKPGKALEILDRMTVAGRLGNAELEDLSGIFSTIGGDAKEAGMGFDKTLAFVEGLSFVRKEPERLATLASSTLRVFTNMRYMASAQKATGIQFFASDGSRRDPLAVLSDIKQKYDTLKTDAQRAKFINAAFGKADLDTIKGIRTLLTGDALSRLGRFEAEIARAGGTLKNDFSEATRNLIDQSGMLKNDLREAADGFAKPINETLGHFIQFVRDKKENGGWGLDGKDMILGGAGLLGGTALLARYGGKAFGGLAGKFLKGSGSLAAGVAQGKMVEAATGVAPVFVTNWPAGGIGSAGGGIAEGLTEAAVSKGGWLKGLKSIGGKLAGRLSGLGAVLGGTVGSAGLLTTAGGVAAAGAGGYAIGAVLEKYLVGGISSLLSNGKYSGSGAIGDMIYDAIHGTDQERINKIEVSLAVDRENRLMAKTTSRNTSIDASVMRRGFL